MNMTHFYTGVTAYFVNNPETNLRMKALVTALLELGVALITLSDAPASHLNRVTGSVLFNQIRANAALFTPSVENLPAGTPEHFQQPLLALAEIDMLPHLALYVPVAGTGRTRSPGFR